jgi:hypothetical protein
MISSILCHCLAMSSGLTEVECTEYIFRLLRRTTVTLPSGQILVAHVKVTL